MLPYVFRSIITNLLISQLLNQFSHHLGSTMEQANKQIYIDYQNHQLFLLYSP